MIAAAAGPVLIIDDSLTIRKLLEMALDRAGQPYEVAALGREGIALAKRLRPRLVLLDYVLPDIKGNEVCDALAGDPLTAGVPVVIMSGKGDDIRQLFRHQRTVVDFIAKPFSPAEILHVMQRVLGTPAAETNGSDGPITRSFSAPAAPAAAVAAPLPTSPSSPSREAKEAAAKVLFSALRDRLARVPEWLAESGGQPPAPFLARRLLTPEVVGTVLAGLAPINAPAPVMVSETPTEFAGSTGFLPLLQLLRLAAESHRAGELRLGGANGLSVFCERGQVVLVAPRDPGAARRVLASVGHSEDPVRIMGWESEARSGGVPAALAAAAEAGASGAEILARLARQGLVQLANQGPVTYAWHDLPALPSAVQTLISLTPPLALGQLALDRLRQVDDWSQIELEVRSLGQVCARPADFATRLGEFTLTPTETAVLLQVDGRRPVQEILERTGLSTFDVFHVLYRLLQVRLIELPGDHVQATGAVLLVDADEAGIASPLAAWLGRRDTPLDLVRVSAAEVVSSIQAHLPRLALIDLDAVGGTGSNLPQAIRGELTTSAVPLAALVTWADRNRRKALKAAGWDQVLVKPVHLHAIGHLLSGRTTP